jgi:CO/xanthine dehydrogenase Mo-binding subunit
MKDGEVENRSFKDYKIPTGVDIPSIETSIVEQNSEEGPYGAKGVGEPPINPPAAAIANAVYDAVGVRIKELPITPEKIMRALRDKSDS